MRNFSTFSLLAIAACLAPSSILAAPAPIALAGSTGGGLTSGLTNLVPTTSTSPATGSNLLPPKGEDATGGHSAADPAIGTSTGTTASNPATISGLVNAANDAANIVGNTVDTLSNNDNNSLLDDNQIANINLSGEQGSENGNGNGNGSGGAAGKGNGAWSARKW